jgi:hypothetical protein
VDMTNQVVDIIIVLLLAYIKHCSLESACRDP